MIKNLKNDLADKLGISQEEAKRLLKEELNG